MHRRSCRLLALSATIALGAGGGCRARQPAVAPQPPAPAPAPSGPPTDTVPADTALHNLDARIELFERQGRQPRGAEQRAAAVSLLSLRAQLLARLSDYDRALALAEEAVRAAPGDAAALLVRAGAYSHLHRFAAATADLDEAARLGSRDPRLETLRASILQATGHEREAIAIYQRRRAAFPTLESIGAEATARGAIGDFRSAEALFALARSVYRDVSPFPLAWLDYQHGVMLQRQGDAGRAADRYRAALTRLPAYADAAAHLAELEVARGADGRARATALLRPLLTASDDPEFPGQLSELVRLDGDLRLAGELRQRAADGYEKLLAKHREAFLDHAAQFWLGAGGDPARAVPLAEENARLRDTADARALLARARAAAGLAMSSAGGR